MVVERREYFEGRGALEISYAREDVVALEVCVITT